MLFNTTAVLTAALALPSQAVPLALSRALSASYEQGAVVDAPKNNLTKTCREQGAPECAIDAHGEQVSIAAVSPDRESGYPDFLWPTP